mgnify:CR=1 FL=1
MSAIVTINETGNLQLPEEILQAISPHTHFQVELTADNRVILSPLSSEKPFWATATPQERAEKLREWVRSHKDGPNLPDEALRRENIY